MVHPMMTLWYLDLNWGSRPDGSTNCLVAATSATVRHTRGKTQFLAVPEGDSLKVLSIIKGDTMMSGLVNGRHVGIRTIGMVTVF